MTMVFVALVLVLLMVFASFAVDVGGLVNARRLDQNSADAGALAAAQDLGAANSQVYATIKKYVGDTLGSTFTDAQWNSCGAAAGIVTAAMTNPNESCITFDATRSKIEVRLPTQQYSTAFGKIVGLTSFSHSAFAVAGLQAKGFGGVLPFGLPATSGDGHVCPKSNSNGLASDPCNGSTSGNFGYLNFGIFATSDCNGAGKDARLPTNIAAGIDHQIQLFTQNAQEIVDTQVCSATVRPNASDTATGNTGNPLGDGFVNGGSFGVGRLQRFDSGLFAGPNKPATAHPRTTTLTGHSGVYDDNGLWDFIPDTFPAGASVPASCQRNQFIDSAGNLAPFSNWPQQIQTYLKADTSKFSLAQKMTKLMQRCMTEYDGVAWGDATNGVNALNPPEQPLLIGSSTATCPNNGCTTPVFSVNSSTSDSPDLYDIQYTSRFGYVPQLTTNFCNGNCTVDFQRFRGIFIDQVCWGNCNSATDLWTPGLNQPGTPQNSVSAFTAWAFPKNMLPGRLGDDDAPNEIGVNRFVSLLR